MAIESFGYAGSIDSADWARMQWTLGKPYWVYDSNDCLPTASVGTARGVDVAPGWLGGHGILDHVVTAETVQVPEVAAGTEYFLIVARRTWQTEQATTFTYVSAGATMPENLSLPGRNVDPGTIDDQPIALVSLSAGSGTVQIVNDLRVFGTGYGAGMSAYDMPSGFWSGVTGNQLGAELNFASGLRARRSLSPSGSGIWAQDPQTFTGSSLISHVTTGFELIGPVTAVVSGHTVQLRVWLKRSHADINFDTNGNVTDFTVCTVAPALPDGRTLRPAQNITGSIVSWGAVEQFGFGTLQTNGVLQVARSIGAFSVIRKNDPIKLDVTYVRQV